MSTTLTMTRQWQIYIPEKIRKLLDLELTDRWEVKVKGKDELILKKTKSPVLKLAGSVKTPPGVKVDLDNIRDQIDYAQEYNP